MLFLSEKIVRLIESGGSKKGNSLIDKIHPASESLSPSQRFYWEPTASLTEKDQNASNTV